MDDNTLSIEEVAIWLEEYKSTQDEKVRKKLKELGHIEQSAEVSRFLLKPDNNYKLTYAAAGISSRQVVDQEIELSTSGEQLHIRKNQEIFYIHGKKLMDLAHEIYERCKR